MANIIENEGITYSITYDYEAYITKITEGEHIVIPSEVVFHNRRCNVSFMGSAYFSSLLVKSIKIPSSVKEIGNFSLMNCPNLECISILGRNTKIHRRSFDRCNNVKEIKMCKDLIDNICDFLRVRNKLKITII